jgi:hypothetical protein
MSSSTLTLMTMVLYFAVALPTDVSMSATLDQVPASTTTPPKGHPQCWDPTETCQQTSLHKRLSDLYGFGFQK